MFVFRLYSFSWYSFNCYLCFISFSVLNTHTHTFFLHHKLLYLLFFLRKLKFYKNFLFTFFWVSFCSFFFCYLKYQITELVDLKQTFERNNNFVLQLFVCFSLPRWTINIYFREYTEIKIYFKRLKSLFYLQKIKNKQ